MSNKKIPKRSRKWTNGLSGPHCPGCHMFLLVWTNATNRIVDPGPWFLVCVNRHPAPGLMPLNLEKYKLPEAPPRELDLRSKDYAHWAEVCGLPEVDPL